MELHLEPSGPYTIQDCNVCHNFKKRSLRFGDQERYAADFSPVSLNQSARICLNCAIIHTAIRQFNANDEKGLGRKVVWIYARGPAELPPRTLSLEVYFEGPRPKLELQVYNPLEGRTVHSC